MCSPHGASLHAARFANSKPKGRDSIVLASGFYHRMKLQRLDVVSPKTITRWTDFLTCAACQSSLRILWLNVRAQKQARAIDMFTKDLDAAAEFEASNVRVG